MTGMDMPQITDRAALMRNRARALPEALFLQEHAADELQERLIEVNRTFTSVAIVTGFLDFWGARYPDATIVPDDDTLDLKPQAHDLILHTMCLHWANDPVGQLVQARHALKPDGLLLCTFLGGQTLHELRMSLAEAEVAITGGLSPRIAPMGEIRDLGGLLQRAGFALPVADGTPLTASYVNAFHLMHDLRKMGENNALTGRIKHPTRRNVLTEAACIYADNFRNTENRVDATFEFITLTGWAPAESQPQPLRPGSAKTRLADALNTKETPLNRSND
ncbi:methyltransferase family protein [Loktanella sp. PT4BL]|jgi:SAM-dependent methyltransferase|uniref:methyltransferase domain-containing protein n=1 Tax=Loktanella sp. PT4BL TaxID=2135611 RepID=UPI000D8D2A8F|nr:methyltransferase domain-containing protein [Loktanella sp. PT4BL]PXW71953.1 methyltransferase family protein [Loktanella sp. PT4BL]